MGSPKGLDYEWHHLASDPGIGWYDSTVFWLLVPVSVAFLAAACSDGIRAGDGPGAEVRNFTGAHTRVVWAQGDGTDPAAEGTSSS